MKKLVLTLVVCLALFTGCAPDKKGCGEEKAALLHLDTPAKFIQYNMAYHPDGVPSPDGSVIYFTKYTTLGGRSYMTIGLTLTKVCTAEPYLLSVDMELLAENSDIKDSLVVNPGSGNIIHLPVPSIGSAYYTTDQYITMPDNAIETTASATSSFPSQGGWQADSTYFFGQLVKFDIYTNHRLPE